MIFFSLKLSLHKKKFCFKDFVIFTEEILNGKLHFLCSVFISCPNNLTKNVPSKLLVHFAMFQKCYGVKSNI